MLDEILDNKDSYPHIHEAAYRAWVSINSLEFSEAAIVAEQGMSYGIELRKNGVESNREEMANLGTVLEWYFKLIERTAGYWICLQDQRYEDSWEFLVDCQDGVFRLEKFVKNGWRFGFSALNKYFLAIEKLYPYKFFFSAEMIVEKTCSLCGHDPLSPNCSHETGRLYFGDLAINNCRIITALGAAITENPVDKRCRMFVIGRPYSLPQVKFFRKIVLEDEVVTPLTAFELIDTQEIVAVTKALAGRNDECPCGSKKKFKNCHNSKDTITVPHLDIKFHDPLPVFAPWKH